MFMPFHALGGRGCYFLFATHSAPALSVAIWVCSFVKAAAISASSALLVVYMPQHS